jgi:hypothetical protein
MIAITVDMSQASAEEIEAFYATPGVARAVDEWAHADRRVQIRLHEPCEPVPFQIPTPFDSSR